MEKADILEMTVKHLRTVQRQQFEGRHIVLMFPVIKFEKYLDPEGQLSTEFKNPLTVLLWQNLHRPH